MPHRLVPEGHAIPPTLFSPGKVRLRILGFLAACLIGLLAYGFWITMSAPAGTEDREIVLEIPQGFTKRQIASYLVKEGVLRNQLPFLILSYLKGRTSLKAGEYLLRPTMSPLQIFRFLREGKVLLHPLVVPEGFNTKDIGAALEKTGIGHAEAFIQESSNRDLLRELGIESDRAEGYLFPDTYSFPKGTSPQIVIRRMVQNFQKRFGPKLKARASEQGMTVHEVVTLASIIEKEAHTDTEKPLIAAVFLNRLKLQIPLQADPTVIYSLPHFDGNIHKEDLRFDSPYNTYRYRGLPPGPIANPGIVSLQAALHPAPVKYLYFVSKNDGEHSFSETLQAHNRAVRQYQIKKR